jgi:hypothetical protein
VCWLVWSEVKASANAAPALSIADLPGDSPGFSTERSGPSTASLNVSSPSASIA